MKRLTLIFCAALASCATKPPPVTPIINCPQPTSEALESAQPLPRVVIQTTDPGEVVGALGIVIATDEEIYNGEKAKREALIKHGTERCGWTR